MWHLAVLFTSRIIMYWFSYNRYQEQIAHEVNPTSCYHDLRVVKPLPGINLFCLFAAETLPYTTPRTIGPRRQRLQ